MCITQAEFDLYTKGIARMDSLAGERPGLVLAVVTAITERDRYRAFILESSKCHRWLFCSCRRKARKALQ